MSEVEVRVARCIGDAIREVNTLRASGEQLPESPDTVLVGDGGALDSLGFVNLAVALEDSVQREFSQGVAVVGELLAAPDPSAFRTVALLGTFVSERIHAQEP